MENKITIELTTLQAKVLQRMLVEEIENQEKWMVEEEQEFATTDHETREKIISQCEDLRIKLETKELKDITNAYRKWRLEGCLE